MVKGHKHSDETKKKMSLAGKGKTRSEETKKKMSISKMGDLNPSKRPDVAKKISESNKGNHLGESNGNWRGSKVSYRALHCWVVWHMGKAVRCVQCGLTKIPEGKKRYFQWSNISRQYKRDLNDWQQLCLKCHKLFDKKI